MYYRSHETATLKSVCIVQLWYKQQYTYIYICSVNIHTDIYIYTHKTNVKKEGYILYVIAVFGV
jgi:hypothetical protein